MRRLILLALLALACVGCNIETFEDGSARINVNDSITIILHSEN